MRYEEIIERIGQSKNLYEEKNGIKTLRIYELIKDDDIALFIGEKSDNTKTLFLGFKTNKHADQWGFIAPSHNQMVFLKVMLPECYHVLDQKNSKDRKMMEMEGIKNV